MLVNYLIFGNEPIIIFPINSKDNFFLNENLFLASANYNDFSFRLLVNTDFIFFSFKVNNLFF